jgi:hypothetical protein
MNSVSIVFDKHEFDSQLFDPNGKSNTISTWLDANVGNCSKLDKIFEKFALGFERGVWDSHHTYDGSDIICTYTFKKHEDAVLFALRWS